MILNNVLRQHSRHHLAYQTQYCATTPGFLSHQTSSYSAEQAAGRQRGKIHHPFLETLLELRRHGVVSDSLSDLSAQSPKIR